MSEDYAKMWPQCSSCKMVRPPEKLKDGKCSTPCLTKAKAAK